MTEDTLYSHPVGGLLPLPRKKGPGYTWASVHLPKQLHEVIFQLARDEDRSISGMMRRLAVEALEARGIVIPEGVPGDEEPNDAES